MASERLIKRRIKSAGNIAKITRAMQMVAASKMKKAQNAALSGRPYAEKISQMVYEFVKRIEKEKHPLLKTNLTGKSLVIVISTNKGLCGGLNTNLTRSLAGWFSDSDPASVVYVTLGKKGESYVVRTGKQLLADFSDKIPFNQNVPALTQYISEGYIKGEFKQVYLVYNNFISALKQEPVRKKILPLQEFSSSNMENQAADETGKLQFIVEPDIDSILDPLLFNYLENQVRDSILEAEASEHSARMIAMKNATDNANDFMHLLTLEYNKARQEKITYEIADIVTARIAVE